jgi:hypothetical protein
MSAKSKSIMSEKALNHLQILNRSMEKAGGFLELRTFDEKDKSDAFGRNIFIPVPAETEALEAAVQWAARENKKGRGVFVGVNPRANESGTKKDVESLTTAFLDLDIEKRGIDRAEAIAELNELSPIPPDFVTDSGGGLHVYYFMQPTQSYDEWRDLQETLYDKFQHIGADRSVVTDSSRVMRLTGFVNWKYEKDNGGKPTDIVEFTTRERTPSINSYATLFDVKPRAKATKTGLPDTMPEGGTEKLEGRNTLLFREAAALRNRGYSEGEILATLYEVNRIRCVPPLPEEEVERIAGSATRYEPTGELGTSLDYGDNRFGYTFGEFVRTQFPPNEWVIHGLNDGEIGMLNAIPNAGKTTLALNLSMSMAIGREFYPMYAGGKPRRVMYMDFENRKGFLQRDLIQMATNFSEEERAMIDENLFIAVDQEIYGAEMNLSNQEHLDLVMAEAHSHKADFIIIDTMAAAFTFANENDNSEAEKVVIKPLKALARQTGAAVLLIHHIGKAGETGDRSKLYAGRGASAFAAAARLVMNMDALKDGNGRPVKNHIVLSSPKVKGKPFDDTVFELDFPRRWFEAADVVLPDETSRQEIIWSVIDKPMKRHEVIAALAELGHEVSESTVSRALKLGVATGKIKKGAVQGTYIPAPPQDETGDVDVPENLEFEIAE